MKIGNTQVIYYIYVICDMICSHRMATLFHESTSGMPCVFGAGVGSATRPCLSMLTAGCGTFG